MYKYLDIVEKEVNTAAEMAGIEVEDAKEMLDAYFKALDYLLDDERIPEVAIQSMGTLKYSKSRLRQSLEGLSTYKMKEENKERYDIQIPLIEERIRKSKEESGVGYWWSFVPKNFASQLLELKKKDEGREGICE